MKISVAEALMIAFIVGIVAVCAAQNTPEECKKTCEPNAVKSCGWTVDCEVK